MSALSVLTFLCVFMLLCFDGIFVNGGHVKYNTGGGIVDGKLNVHLVGHSHDDVGWLKTVDQYYTGSNNSIQGACVENVLDSVIVALRKDPNRKFVFAEMAFFHRWWVTQNEQVREQVKELVHGGQLEFVNGGWCMHDEAVTHYIDMIDQTTLGHLLLKDLFNVTPRAGWQIDPFGHSAVQAYLLGAELGFDSVHFARIDYQDRKQRWADKSLEVVWRGSKTFGSSSQIFANAFPVHYNPPAGFSFEMNTDITPVQENITYKMPTDKEFDNHLLFDYNVEERVNDFINAAMSQANVTRTNHVMWTMGDDFQYQYAESWFKQMDKLIHYVNKNGTINALYSTPSIYTDAKNTANETWPKKTHDYLPHADGPNAYWAGFFTGRPGFKQYVRLLSGYYLAARQLEFLVGRKALGSNTYSLGDALAIVQHHDAVTGTARQHTTNDYDKRLAIGASEAEATVTSALSCLTDTKSDKNCSTHSLTLSQCQFLNISFCPPTEEDITDGKSLVVVAYNPLGWDRIDIIRVPVNDENLVVQDSAGNSIESQYIDMDNITSNLRSFYTMAYLGISPNQAPKYSIVFQVSVPPLGWNTYFISKAPGRGKTGSLYIPVVDIPQNETIEIGPGNLKVSLSLASGQIERMFNTKTGVDIPVQQSYLWYTSSCGDSDPQCSGAYTFRPNGSDPTEVSNSVPVKVVRGPLLDEVHQHFSSWIYQVIRLYKDKEHAEVEYTIGPIPTDDGIGKELITRLTTNMATEKVFYTDSNGRDFLKRVRDYREDWPLTVTQPVAGNYYPLCLGIYMTDNKSEISVLVDHSAGGASIQDGQMEVMLHRRLVCDDSQGIVGTLNETVCAGSSCEGLTVRGNYYIGINEFSAGSQWRRTTGQEIYSPLLLAFTHETQEDWIAYHVVKETMMEPNYTLPLNVALLTLQELDNGQVLLRLAHLYEDGEDIEYSRLAVVELKKVFAQKRIKEIKEMSLSANQEKAKMNKMTWKVEGDEEDELIPPRGGPVENSTLIVELGPMEIRTFLLKF